MSYVDAGYAIALSVLALYSVGLVLRRRRLTRAAALMVVPGGRPGGLPGERAGGTAPAGPAAGAGADPTSARPSPAEVPTDVGS